jgi:hypothetical protein
MYNLDDEPGWPRRRRLLDDDATITPWCVDEVLKPLVNATREMRTDAAAAAAFEDIVQPIMDPWRSDFWVPRTT